MKIVKFFVIALLLPFGIATDGPVELFSNGEGDLFGHAMALSGKMLVVGAPATSVDGLPNAGVAYVYKQLDDTWELDDVLTHPQPEAGNFFGSSVVLEDFLVVGASMEFNGRPGEAVVFGPVCHCCPGAPGPCEGPWIRAPWCCYVSGGFEDRLWEFSKILQPTDILPFDRYGFSTALSQSALAVGAFNHGERGKVYIYSVDRVEGVDDEPVDVLLPLWNDSRFGWSIALQDDYVFVGAPYHSSGDGCLYFFQKDDVDGYYVQDIVFGSSERPLLGHSVDVDATFLAVASLSSQNASVLSYSIADGYFDLEEVHDQYFEYPLFDVQITVDRGLAILASASGVINIHPSEIFYHVNRWQQRRTTPNHGCYLPVQEFFYYPRRIDFTYSPSDYRFYRPRVVARDDVLAFGPYFEYERRSAIVLTCVPPYVGPDPPTTLPSAEPSAQPTLIFSEVPSAPPSGIPSEIPSEVPSEVPSDVPSQGPSSTPSIQPSDIPTAAPSDAPSLSSQPTVLTRHRICTLYPTLPFCR